MTREEAVKKAWDLVSTEDADDLRAAEELAYEYEIFMAFDPAYIAVEDDVYYLHE